MAVGAVIGTILSIGSAALGMAAGAKRDASSKAAAKEQNRYNKENWKRSERERKDDYRWNVRAVELAQYNSDAAAAYKDQVNLQSWADEQALQDWELEQEVKAWLGAGVEEATQKEYNIVSEALALAEQDAWKSEALNDLTWKSDDLVDGLVQDMAQIDVQIAEVNRTYTRDKNLLNEDRSELSRETQKQLDMIVKGKEGITAEETKRITTTAANKGLITNRRDKELKSLIRQGEKLSNAGVKSRGDYSIGRQRQLHELRGKKATTARELQKSQIASLRAAGEAAALGQAGRSARRNIQSVLMEHALHQAALNSSLTRDVSLFNLENQALLNAYNIEREDQRITAQSIIDQEGSAKSLATLETNKVTAEDTYGRTMEGVKRGELDIEKTYVDAMKTIGDRRLDEKESFIEDIKNNTVGGLQSKRKYTETKKTDEESRLTIRRQDLLSKDQRVRNEIAHDKWAADLAADKIQGSKPQQAPQKTIPHKIPRTKFMQPRLPEKLVKPGKAISVGNANFLSGAAAGVGAIGSTVASADWTQ